METTTQDTTKQKDLGSVKVDESITAAGRLDKMLGSDSPLMKRAETQGKQYANKRGLLNSSMAAGASQGAMIDAATPIAAQDSNNLMQSALSGQQFDQETQMVDTKAYANMRGQFLDSTASMINESNINISEIQSSSDIPAAEKQKMIAQQIAMRDADMRGLEALFKSQPMWEQNWANL